MGRKTWAFLTTPGAALGAKFYKVISKEEPRLNAINYQQSTFAAVKALVYGTTRLAGNIIDSIDLKAIPHTSTQQTGGKGGPVTDTSTTTYTYRAKILIGICFGVIAGVSKIWKDKSLVTLAKSGFSLYTGTNSQSAWGSMVTAHPERALAYRNFAYVAASLNLGDSASVPQYSFEIKGKLIYGGSIVDSNPADIIEDILTNTLYGVGLDADYVDDFSDYSDFCVANGIFISPAYNDQKEATQVISDITHITNSAFVWSQGKLKIIPCGDEVVTGNSVTWTPDLTPIYDLTTDDFLAADEPFEAFRTPQADIYNSIKLEYLNRDNDYNIEIVEAQNQANIELYGYRPADTLTAHSICSSTIAKKTAQLALDLLPARRNRYKFKLPLKYILLDPMDIVSVTYSKLGLDSELVRITSIKEDGDGKLDFEVEDMNVGSATPALYENQEATRTSIDYNQEVGNINPAIMYEPPFELTQDQLIVSVAASGNNEYFGGADVWVSDAEDGTYRKIGSVTNPCRQGVLSSILASGSDPDSVNTLAVDLSMSYGELLSGSQADADNLNTLCYVNGELIAYETATLTDDYEYDLTYLRRGAYGSTISAHAISTQFARIDDSFVPIPFKQEDIGKTLYIKFTSFNVFGGGYQELSDVYAYQYEILGTALLQAPSDVENLVTLYTNNNLYAKWAIIDDPRKILYEVRKGTSWENSSLIGQYVENQVIINGNGTYYVKVYVPEANVYSENAEEIIITGARIPQNIIATYDEYDLGFTGTLTNCTVNADDFIEVTDPSAVAYYEIPAGHIVDIGKAQLCNVSCIYDLNANSSTDDFSLIPDVSLVGDIAGAYGQFVAGSKIQINLAGDDEVYAGWQDLNQAQYFFRIIKFRAVLISTDSTVAPILEAMTTMVDVPDLFQSGASTTSSSADISVTFNTPYQDVADNPNLQISINDSQSGDYLVISSQAYTGFSVSVYNSGSRVVRSISHLAFGY